MAKRQQVEVLRRMYVSLNQIFVTWYLLNITLTWLYGLIAA